MIKGHAVQALNIGILLVILFYSFPSASALDQGTILRRDLVIDLGDGVTTDAQLTYPAVGDGPFPGVLLIHGSGSIDMDEYIPSFVTGTGEPSRPFLQIAEYLSERGFVVLRYNKRGVGLNSTLVNQEVYMNATFQILKEDAETALSVLMEQSEVDTNDITLLGHSEGTMIVPRIAVENPNVKKVALLGAVAHNLRDILEYQLFDRRAAYLEEAVDGDRDGLISIQEVLEFGESDILSPVPDFALIENSTGEWQWYPGIDTNGDLVMSIHEEFRTRQLNIIELMATSNFPVYKWIQSHYDLGTTMGMIGNVTCSILILQGEAEAQAPIQEALLLEQRLTEIGHPDHTLITYPGLGHSFYPVEGWKQPLGPIQDYVLSDLTAWLKDPERNFHSLAEELRTATTTIEDLQGQIVGLRSEFNQRFISLESQIDEMRSESAQLKNMVTELVNSNDELRIPIYSSKNLTYIALGVALIAILVEIVMTSRRRFT